MQMRLIFGMGLMVFLLSGCAQKVTIKALEPAKIDRVAFTKRIAITNFKNDTVGLSAKIEAKLAQFQINDKKYFRVISRNDLKKVIDEQKLQNSGLVDEKTAVKLGEIVGAQAIISGRVSSPTREDSYFYETRIRCADLKCKKIETYKVRCMKRIFSLSSDIKIVDVANTDVIYADTLTKNSSYKHCSDDSHALPSPEMAGQSLAMAIANDFTYKLTPHYRNFEVTLLDEGDLDYTDKQKKLLAVSLEYIEQGRYDKAENLLGRLIDATASKSYVPFYDLGVIKEAEGKYKEAQGYYGEADHLMVEPVEEINHAVLRIRKLIAKIKKTMEQLKR
jgi:tetratricopeptide (TPR) repeat protein